MPFAKPPGVASDALMSAKWDELTAGRKFSEADAPALALLCRWHKVAARAAEEMDSFDGQTAYTAENGDLKPLPQVATLKAASSEIRALSKQLGITGGGEADGEGEPRDNVLSLVAGRRAQRRAGAQG